MGHSSGNPSTTDVRVVVVGDQGTGKSSLISTAAYDIFPKNVLPVLRPAQFPQDFHPDWRPCTMVDTSSRLELQNKLAQELMQADVVVVTYACDNPATLDHLGTFWLPELRRLEVKVPVIVVGCKLDAREETMDLEEVMCPLMEQYHEIETCIECSARNLIQVHEVFSFAQKAVIFPTSPLFDQQIQTLTPRCVRALKRVFILCDHDKDGTLSDAELNNFQVKCFNAPLQPDEIVGVKKVVRERIDEGVNDQGLTLSGFLFLHQLFVEKGRLETTWTVLRQFGYNDELKLRDDHVIVPKRIPDQSVELTNEAIEFLKRIFRMFARDADDVLLPAEVDDLFSTAPKSPWNETPYKDAAEKVALKGLTLDGFLSKWALMTLLEPSKSLAYLTYIGYLGDTASAIRITRSRKLDRKKKLCEKNVLQSFVFGAKHAGKSTLLDSLIGKPFSEIYIPTASERFAVNIVDLVGGNKKTLVLREIPEDGVKHIISDKESLAACDIAIFVYDSSDDQSWSTAAKLLAEVASHGENSGFEVPCLIIAAKDDLGPLPSAIQDSTRASQDMGLEAPVPVSMKLGDNNIFRRIISSAEHPHLSIPETEAHKSRKHHRRSIILVSVGVAVGVVGLATFRVYTSRRNNSG